MTHFRTFEALRGARADWCTSLAYWLGTYRGPCDADAIVRVADGMSLQYDWEEQADAVGGAVLDVNDWARVFTPIAPVQLCLSWSPVPSAVTSLGEPNVESATESPLGIRAVAAVWDANRIAEVRVIDQPSAAADESRFLGLAAVAVSRARVERRGVLLVAKPGWSYDSEHEVSDETVRLMLSAGFVTTTRRP